MTIFYLLIPAETTGWHSFRAQRIMAPDSAYAATWITI
ncbi:hypothetical protein M3J09_007101 [Ascochyta lentis]